jgi:hypothetical protein
MYWSNFVFLGGGQQFMHDWNMLVVRLGTQQFMHDWNMLVVRLNTACSNFPQQNQYSCDNR